MVEEDAEESGIDQDPDGRWDDGWWLEVGRRKQVAAQSVEAAKDGSRYPGPFPCKSRQQRDYSLWRRGIIVQHSGIHFWLDRRMISFPESQTFSILRGSLCGELSHILVV